MFYYLYALFDSISNILQSDFEDTGIGDFLMTSLRDAMGNWWYSLAYSEDNCMHPVPVVYILLFFVCVCAQRIYRNRMALGNKDRMRRNKRERHEVRYSKMIVRTLLLNLMDLKNLILKEKILEFARIKLHNVATGLKKKRLLKDYQQRIIKVNLALKKAGLLDTIQERLDGLYRTAGQDKHLKLVQGYLKELSRFMQMVRRARRGDGRMPNLLGPLALISCEITTLIKMVTVFEQAKLQEYPEHCHKADAQKKSSANLQPEKNQDSSISIRDCCCHLENKPSKNKNIIFKIIINNTSTSEQEEIILNSNAVAEGNLSSSSGCSIAAAASEIIEPPTHDLLDVSESAEAVMCALVQDYYGNDINSFSHEQCDSKSVIDSWGYSFSENISSFSEKDTDTTSSLEEKNQRNCDECVYECNFVKNKVKEIEESNFSKTGENDTSESSENNNCNTAKLVKIEFGCS